MGNFLENLEQIVEKVKSKGKAKQLAFKQYFG